MRRLEPLRSKSGITVGTIEVFGVAIDAETRCAHYQSELDVIAIKVPCCHQYYSCYECHQELADHPPQRWDADQKSEKGVICGKCGTGLTIGEYKSCDSQCPDCGARFNPGCKTHWHLYFSE